MRILPSRLHWPSVCAVCSRWPSSRVCDMCMQRLGSAQSRCPGCALPLAPGLLRCVRCQEAPLTPLENCHARVTYSYPWVDIVARFKFQGQPAWARELAGWMLETPEARTLLDEADLIAPVPLTPARLRERGYNQAWELVKGLRAASSSKAVAWPDLLEREADARLQHTLPREQRLANARQALQCSPGRRSAVAGRHVLLVDDVMTTGATLQAAALVLREAGAATVSGLVFARTPAPGAVE
ncbi:ComF family protein [Hydrogenophaga aquatica]